MKEDHDALSDSRSTKAEQKRVNFSERPISRRDLHLLPFSALSSLIVSGLYLSLRAKSVLEADRAGFVIWSVFLIELAIAGIYSFPLNEESSLTSIQSQDSAPSWQSGSPSEGLKEPLHLLL